MQGDVDTYSEKELKKKTVDKLKVMCRELKIPVGGSKQVIIKRILDMVMTDPARMPPLMLPAPSPTLAIAHNGLSLSPFASPPMPATPMMFLNGAIVPVSRSVVPATSNQPTQGAAQGSPYTEMEVHEIMIEFGKSANFYRTLLEKIMAIDGHQRRPTLSWEALKKQIDKLHKQFMVALESEQKPKAQPSGGREDEDNINEAYAESMERKEIARREAMDFPQLFDLFYSVWGKDAKNGPLYRCTREVTVTEFEKSIGEYLKMEMQNMEAKKADLVDHDAKKKKSPFFVACLDSVGSGNELSEDDTKNFLIAISVPPNFVTSAVATLRNAGVVNAMTLAALDDPDIRSLSLNLAVSSVLVRAAHTLRTLLFLDQL